MKHEPGIETEIKEEVIDGERWVVISIQDNGIGWYWDDMPIKVREKYLKTKRNVESVGGKFYYENIPKEGARVTMKIPSYLSEGNKKFKIPLDK